MATYERSEITPRPPHRLPPDLPEVVSVWAPDGEYLGPLRTREKIRWLLAGDPLAELEIQRKKSGAIKTACVYLSDLDAFLTLEAKFKLTQYMPIEHALVEQRHFAAELAGVQKGETHARHLGYFEPRAAGEVLEAKIVQQMRRGALGKA